MWDYSAHITTPAAMSRIDDGWREMEEGIMFTLFTTGVWLFCPQQHSP
jgi:hypothetical protein